MSIRTTLSKAVATSTMGVFLLMLTSMINPTDDIIGTWIEAKDDNKMEIFKSGNEYQAKLLFSKAALEADGKTFKKDIKNNDPKLRSRSLEGIVYITKLRFNKGAYVDGKMYDFTSGNFYDCKITVSGNKLNLRGFMGFEFLGKTIEFNRVK
ncbi:MAG: DUF2147 domain-containing protein [Sporocytophaga sp.]|uniref:DUF2147 domain-containing protein n=1 Tax=Sporocytophaga sp. TaxID=2231183 RepID=UPI001B122C32|nr:DUF2147 domain-containing protein [Sporocytophaga sp.]MBO9702106.1 DUF2147 domain-containing protein [Sporocytophaga sp.]